MDLADRSTRMAPLLETFSALVNSNPSAIAIVDGSHTLSRRELYHAAMVLAENLVALAPRGTPVGLFLGNDVTFAIGALACVAAGVPHVALDVRYPPARNAAIARRAGIGVIVQRRDLPFAGARALPEIAHAVLDAETLAAGIAPESDTARPPRPLGLDEPFVLLFTSGSTGVPKGVAHSQRSFLHSVYPDIDVLALGEHDRSLGIWSPSTIAGLRAALSALLSGARSVVVDPLSGLTNLVATIRDERITICRAVPALVRALAYVEGAREAMRHVRVLQLGGERVYGSDIDLLRPLLADDCRISIGFGSTEAGIVAQWFVTGEIRGVVPCGFAVARTKLEIVAANGTIAAADSIGELRSTGAATALGFWDAGRLDGAAFPPLRNDDSVRSHATGDLFRYDDAGRLVHAGRVDRMLKINGRRVDLGDVEAAVRRHAGVREAAVVARENAGAPQLVAFVVMDTEDDREIDALRASLRAELPAHMVLSEIRRLREIPQLPGYKPDLAALDRLAATADPRSETPPATTSIGDDRIARAVLRAWSDTLDARSARRNARWNEAGGDSMRMLLLAFRIERLLERQIPFVMLAPEMRPSELIAKLREESYPTHVAGLPTLVLCPGREGDDPRLVRFRRTFERELRTFVPAYLPWHAESGTAPFETIAEDVVAQIVRSVSGRPLLIAGYSFGGFVAHEVARRLALRGEHVAFVGLLDANLAWNESEPPVPQSAAGRIAHLASSIRKDGVARTFTIRSGYRLAWIVHKRPKVLAFFARSGRRLPLPAETRFFFDYKMMRYVRDALIKTWHPHVLEMPATLFRASAGATNARPDNGWRTSTPQLTIENAGGSHLSMIEGAHGERLGKKLAGLALLALARDRFP